MIYILRYQANKFQMLHQRTRATLLVHTHHMFSPILNNYNCFFKKNVVFWLKYQLYWHLIMYFDI